MGILSGVVSYLLGLIINLLDVAISGFLGTLGFNLEVFETHFPAAKAYYDVIVGFAVGILFIMFIFQVFKNFGVVLEMEAEDPLKMLGKTTLFFGMILYSRSIADIIIHLLVDPYQIFLDTYTATFQFSLLDLLWSMLGGIFTNGFSSVVYIIMLIVLGWQFLKFIVEIVERYIVFCFVLYCAPVVYATGPFKATSQIFKSWTRMVGSQGMLLLLNVWSIKLFTSFMQGFDPKADDLVFNFLIGYAFLKFSQKADTLLRILGLNTASTGEVVRSLGGAIGGIAQSVRTVGGIASKAFSGGQRGAGATRSASPSGNADGMAGAQSGNGKGSSSMGSPGGTGGHTQGRNRSADQTGSVTGSVTDSAKQNYADTILASAKNQMSGESGEESVSPMSGKEESDSLHSDVPDADSGADAVETDGVRMNQDGGKAREPSPFASLDKQTKEGLSHLAHGLPHNQYDPAKKAFSGGGFQEFTGENANIIGSAQMPPADGFSQSQVKMPDGTLGTMYQNPDTGESFLVQFGSVDNGVIQGCISDVEQKNGEIGDRMAFKAVHENVPGAASFSSHSVPISDGSGGAYHLSTGASHACFEAGTFRAASPISSDVSTSAPAASQSNVSDSGEHRTAPAASAPLSGFSTGASSKMPAPDTQSEAGSSRSDFSPGHGSVMRSAHESAEHSDSSLNSSIRSDSHIDAAAPPAPVPGMSGGAQPIPDLQSNPAQNRQTLDAPQPFHRSGTVSPPAGNPAPYIGKQADSLPKPDRKQTPRQREESPEHSAGESLGSPPDSISHPNPMKPE